MLVVHGVIDQILSKTEVLLTLHKLLTMLYNTINLVLEYKTDCVIGCQVYQPIRRGQGFHLLLSDWLTYPI